MLTPASKIYFHEPWGAMHVALEANFQASGGASLKSHTPLFTSIYFKPSSVAFWCLGRFWSSSSRGSMLMLWKVGGVEINRFIFQANGVMPPAIIPAFSWDMPHNVHGFEVELQFAGEMGCNFEFHTTAIIRLI